jgi:hypothetical protein
VFSKNRGHRIITFEQAHRQVEHPVRSETSALNEKTPPATGTIESGPTPPGTRQAEPVGRDGG